MTDLRAQIMDIEPATHVRYPKFAPRFIEEGCAHHYGNTTYDCSCLIPRQAVLALLDDDDTEEGLT